MNHAGLKAGLVVAGVVGENTHVWARGRNCIRRNVEAGQAVVEVGVVG